MTLNWNSSLSKSRGLTILSAQFTHTSWTSTATASLWTKWCLAFSRYGIWSNKKLIGRSRCPSLQSLEKKSSSTWPSKFWATIKLLTPTLPRKTTNNNLTTLCHHVHSDMNPNTYSLLLLRTKNALSFNRKMLTLCHLCANGSPNSAHLKHKASWP